MLRVNLHLLRLLKNLMTALIGTSFCKLVSRSPCPQQINLAVSLSSCQSIKKSVCQPDINLSSACTWHYQAKFCIFMDLNGVAEFILCFLPFQILSRKSLASPSFALREPIRTHRIPSFLPIWSDNHLISRGCYQSREGGTNQEHFKKRINNHYSGSSPKQTLSKADSTTYVCLHKTQFFSTPIKSLYFYIPRSGQLQ